MKRTEMIHIMGDDKGNISFESSNMDPRAKEIFDKIAAERKKKGQEPEGLGDLIEGIFEKTGIKKVVEKVTKGKDCGCRKRKQMLNRILPLGKRKPQP